MKQIRVLLTGLLLLGPLMGWVVQAQPYSPADRMLIADKARRLIQTKYLDNLDILTHYEAHQPFEALESQLNGLIRDAFRSRDVLVSNEFRDPAHGYTTVSEYINDCRIFSGGKPVVNKLNLPLALYDIQVTRAGQSFVNVYLNKQIEGVDRHKKPFRYQHLTEFRVQFRYDAALKTYLDVKIAGISRVDAWPATAFPFMGTDPGPADPVDLSVVLTDLARRLAAALPAGTRHLTLEPFTYARSGIRDALSDRIFATLSSCLQRQDSLLVPSAAESEGGLLVRGYYRGGVNTLTVTAELVDPATGQRLATIVDDDLPLTWLSEQKLPPRPDAYRQVTALQDTLHRTMALPATALRVEIRTDRGRGNVEYWENQVMRIEAIASRPCHLRLLYRLADGTQTILENDFVIKPGQENRPIRVAPDAAFVCSAPFGTEYLLAYASETAFCPLPVVPGRQGYVRKEGEYMLFVGPLSAMLTTLKCTRTPGADVAEDRIQITTRPTGR